MMVEGQIFVENVINARKITLLRWSNDHDLKKRSLVQHYSLIRKLLLLYSLLSKNHESRHLQNCSNVVLGYSVAELFTMGEFFTLELSHGILKIQNIEQQSIHGGDPTKNSLLLSHFLLL